MKAPLVSVIIPTYKSRGGLQKSIESVLAQTYHNLEIIIIDDNNPNTEERIHTEKQMRKYTSNPKIIYLQHEVNKNGSAARNTGIYHSTGDYIAFLDDDDEWMPTKITKQINYILNNNVDGVYTRFVSNNKIPYITPYQGNAIIPLLMGRTRMYTSTLLLSRKSVMAINGFDESFRRHQDYEFLIRFFNHGYKIGYIDDALVKYGALGGNMLIGKDLELLKDKFLYTFNSIIEKIDSNNPGKGLEIVVSNYAIVFYSNLSFKQYKDAYNILIKYFRMSPICFINQIYFMIKSKLLTKKYKI